MDISDHVIIQDRQRELDRLSQVEIMRDRSRAKWRHEEADVTGLNLVSEAVRKQKSEAMHSDQHRMARIKQLSHSGKQRLRYSADAIHRSNYMGMMER